MFINYDGLIMRVSGRRQKTTMTDSYVDIFCILSPVNPQTDQVNIKRNICVTKPIQTTAMRVEFH